MLPFAGNALIASSRPSSSAGRSGLHTAAGGD
jgi:hypothetical protein